MPVSNSKRDEICCEVLRQYLFDNVWNEPESEYRINVHPQVLRNKSCVGSFTVLDANIYLPKVGESYFLWYMKSNDINIGLDLKPCVWYDLTTVCNEYRTLVHAYTESGCMLPKCSVFIRYNQSKTIIYIAVKKRAYNLCTPYPKLDDLYLTFYYDSDVVNDIRIYSVEVKSTRGYASILSQMTKVLNTANSNDCILEFCNGMEITDPDNTPELEYGNFYDIIIDNNIIGSFEIDLTNNNESPVFLSTKDKVWKQIIHIPKSVNPDNYVITHNTCDLFVRIKGTHTGRYIHRATNGRTVGQITHNDLSIPLFVLDAYRDYLHDQNIVVHGVIRKHDKDNVLIRDSNYIDLLYNEAHSDDDIIKFLSNENKSEMTFWKAENLESSKYVELMFDSPNGTSTDIVSDCILGLGYYSTVNLLCKRTVSKKITKSFDGTIRFNLPLIFADSKVLPVIYINGKQLKFKYYSYVSNAVDNVCDVIIDKDVYTPAGSTISAVFSITDNDSVYTFSPSEDNLNVEVPYKNPVVYQKMKLGKSVVGINKSSNYSYTRIEYGNNIYMSTDTDKGVKLTFNSSLSDTEFVIQNPHSSYVRTYDLKNYTKTGKSIAIPINTNEDTPLLDITNLFVFFNGDYLVKNVDYFVNTIRDSSGKESFSELVIQSMDHFSENGDNSIDVVYSIVNTEEYSSGFTVNNRIADETPVNLFFPGITNTHVNGLLELEGEYHGTYIKVKDGKYPEGSVFEIQTAVPHLVTEFLSNYGRNSDLEKLNILNRYFYKSINLSPDYLVMESKHRIYSVFMNNFINDVVNGVVPVIDDPDTKRFNDLIKPYLYLQKMDLCFTGIDGRFVDLYPQYINYDISPEVKHFIDRYIASLMPENTNPTMEVVYG